VSTVAYEIVPILNRDGNVIYNEWQFDLSLTNRTLKEIIGLHGSIAISDAFRNRLGVYNIRIEPKVAPGETIKYRVSMRHDPKDPGNVAMVNTKTIFQDWIFDSLAFSDGSIVNADTIPAILAKEEEQSSASQ